MTYGHACNQRSGSPERDGVRCVSVPSVSVWLRRNMDKDDFDE